MKTRKILELGDFVYSKKFWNSVTLYIQKNFGTRKVCIFRQVSKHLLFFCCIATFSDYQVSKHLLFFVALQHCAVQHLFFPEN